MGIFAVTHKQQTEIVTCTPKIKCTWGLNMICGSHIVCLANGLLMTTCPGSKVTQYKICCGQFVKLRVIWVILNHQKAERTTTPLCVRSQETRNHTYAYFIKFHIIGEKGDAFHTQSHKDVWTLFRDVTLKGAVLSFIICLKERTAVPQPQKANCSRTPKEPHQSGTDPVSTQS